MNYVILIRLKIPESSYLKIGILLFVLEIAAGYYLFFNGLHHKTDLITITPDIKTPAPAGQGQHGSAKWLQEKDFKKVYDSCVIDVNTESIESGGLVIGKKDLGKGKELVYYIGEDTHTLSVGSTRSGKTRHEVLETIGLCALAGESMLIPDVKGELSDYTAPFLRELGYEVHIIDYDEPELSESYNLLQPVIDYIESGDIPKAVDACWDLVSQLVGEPKGERIWTDGECCAIAGTILAVCYDNRAKMFQKYRNLTNVYHFLVEMCTPIGNSVPLNYYKAQLPDSHPAKALFAVAEIAPSRTRNSFYTAALMTLRLFTNPNMYNITKSTSFRPEEMGERKMATFIILPEDRTTYHPIATLFISQTYNKLSKHAKENGGRLPVRVEVIWDECGNFTKIPDFTQFLTVSGGKGIRWHLFVQDYAQLDTKYEKDPAKTIRNNCETKVYLRSADVDTREIISKDLDNYTTKAYSINSSKTGETSSSSSLVGRRLLTASDVGKIKRPYSLIMKTSDDPAIMYAPDLSQWSFNQRFGMGNKEHNQRLRMERHQKRVDAKCGVTMEGIELWGIWRKYQEFVKMKQKEKAESGVIEGGDDE